MLSTEIHHAGPAYVSEAAQLLLAFINRNGSKTLHLLPRRAFRDPEEMRNEIIVVRSGLVSLFKTDETGRRQIVALRYPGECILPPERQMSIGVQPIIRSDVVVGSAIDFDDEMAVSPNFQQTVSRVMHRNLAIGYEWLTNCGLRDATSRVAHLVCETFYRLNVDPHHNILMNPLTQQQIAQITGQTAVNVNRVLSELERLDVLKRRDRDFEVLNWTELRRIANFDAAYLS